MQSDLDLQRRVLVKLYRRYVTADRDWVIETRSAVAWLPDAPPEKLALIGNPGSRVRRLYDRREEALDRLHAARAKARGRAAADGGAGARAGGAADRAVRAGTKRARLARGPLSGMVSRAGLEPATH